MFSTGQVAVDDDRLFCAPISISPSTRLEGKTHAGEEAPLLITALILVSRLIAPNRGANQRYND